MKMPATLRSKLTSYHFNLDKPKENQEYRALAARLTGLGYKQFHALGHYYHGFAREGIEVELWTKTLFNNQWNMKPIKDVIESSLRVFDWAESYIPRSPNIKQGHYLEVTPEMKYWRDHTYKCGYCGHTTYCETPPTEPLYCCECLGSAYLHKEQLPLLELKPVSDDSGRNRQAPAWLLQAFEIRQKEAGEARLEKEFKSRLADIEKKREALNIQYACLKWLNANGIFTALSIYPSNVIYYEHTGKVCFGWRDKFTKAQAETLVRTLLEKQFPYEFEIKVH